MTSNNIGRLLWCICKGPGDPSDAVLQCSKPTCARYQHEKCILPWSTIYTKNDPNYECTECNPYSHYKVLRIREEARRIKSAGRIRSMVEVFAWHIFRTSPNTQRGPKPFPIDLWNQNSDDEFKIKSFFSGFGNALDLIISKYDMFEMESLAWKVHYATNHGDTLEMLKDVLQQEVVRLTDAKKLRDPRDLGILYDILEQGKGVNKIVGSK